MAGISLDFTENEHVALMSLITAVNFALPALRAITFAETRLSDSTASNGSILITLGSSTIHSTFLYVVPSGSIVAFTMKDSSTVSSFEATSNVSDSASIVFTSTTHSAVKEDEAAVIVAFPAETAVTTPLSTVATSLSLESQEMLGLVALSGVTLALNVSVAPTTS